MTDIELEKIKADINQANATVEKMSRESKLLDKKITWYEYVIIAGSSAGMVAIGGLIFKFIGS